MDHNIIEALLDRYQKGETSQQENELVENWLKENNNPNSQWQHFNKSQKDQWLADAFVQIQDSIKTKEPKILTMRSRRQLWWRLAGVAAILAISFTLYLEWPALQSRLHPVQLTALTIPSNQQKQITLADGSKVWINSNSQLSYPKQFDGKTREVYLSGEAYFDIQHDADKPFIIHTGKVVTTVLGTAFDIKEDKNKQIVTVTVTRGKVSVANGNKRLGVITPNQQISFNLLDNKSFKTEVDANKAIAWQNPEIHFDDITFADAALQLQQRFHVKVNFTNDKIKECRFTGTALEGETLDKILKAVCTFNNANYKTKADGSIIIDGPGCN